MNEYTISNELLDRALKVIPTGSQTFSKSHYSLPKGSAPLFLESGSGVNVKDVDGNEFIDLVNGLLCVSLGYGDKDVEVAISEQLKKGISFSLPHQLEMEVSELLINLIPCAEMVRFGKNGTDVTSAAIRLSRAYTGREHIAICGYHGWQDWYIGTTSRDLGVPEGVKNLSHVFKYNDLSSLENLFEEFPEMAAVIMEPMTLHYPDAGFLESIRELCDKYGALLVFDEMITGFRFSINGAQSMFNVKPDLATFGKGMANGMPLSALVGKKEVMSMMDDIFFSGTFGGETLSLAAAKATITKMLDNNVIDHIHSIGKYLNDGVQCVIKKHNVSWLRLEGHDAWKVIVIDAGDKTQLYKSLLIQELIKNGVLTIGSHNISYAMTTKDADCVIKAYELSLNSIEMAIKDMSEVEMLKGEEIKQVFKVR